MPTIMIPHHRNIAGIDNSCWGHVNYDQHMQWTISVIRRNVFDGGDHTGIRQDCIYMIVDATLDGHMKMYKVIMSSADLY
eukprot:6198093-Pleurochrysis_carterae.AAC.3